MSENTKIEWTDASWNPLRARRLSDGKVGWHCEMLSPGCAHCYAQTFNGRKLPNGGTGLDYTKKSSALVETFIDDSFLEDPMRWRRPRKVFVCSMTDLFGEWVSDDQIDMIFAMMERCARHTFQVLTKRADRMADYCGWRWGNREDGPGHRIPAWNIWLGVSAENQTTANKRIPDLIDTPAAVRFVSYEPAIAAVNFRTGIYDMGGGCSVGTALEDIDWLIVGGESGPGARPFDLAWARFAIDQCQAAGTACFVKQLGTMPFDSFYRAGVADQRIHLKHPKGGLMEEWPDDLRVREYPTTERASINRE